VAARAASLLTRSGARRIVDVGAGAGKFCIVGALTTDAEFIGVERREGLVRVARETAAMLGAARATFIHSNVDSFSLEGFDGVYLYNPFYEQISTFLVQIDGAIERSALVYRDFVRSTMDKLAAMAPPVAVVTYNGFGGSMPPGYEFCGDEPAGNDQLELWVKR
jgi:predicted RNA methylase